MRGAHEHELNIVKAWNEFVDYYGSREKINWWLLIGDLEDIDDYQEMIDSELFNAEGGVNKNNAPIRFFLSVDERTFEIVARPVNRSSRDFPYSVQRNIKCSGTPAEVCQHLNTVFADMF